LTVTETLKGSTLHLISKSFLSLGDPVKQNIGVTGSPKHKDDAHFAGRKSSRSGGSIKEEVKKGKSKKTPSMLFLFLKRK